MFYVTWRTVSGTLLGLLLATGLTLPAVAGDPEKMINAGSDGVAIKGYDTVAYFTENQPMKGIPEFTYSWRDAEWYFVNAQHQALFASDPERYAPRFGGFCANGMSKGKIIAANPEIWAVVDGKLYLKFSEKARNQWNQDRTNKIKKGNENWADLQKQD